MVTFDDIHSDEQSYKSLVLIFKGLWEKLFFFLFI